MPGGLLFGDWGMASNAGGTAKSPDQFREAKPLMFRNLFPACRSERAGLEKRPVYPQFANPKWRDRWVAPIPLPCAIGRQKNIGCAAPMTLCGQGTEES